MRPAPSATAWAALSMLFTTSLGFTGTLAIPSAPPNDHLSGIGESSDS